MLHTYLCTHTTGLKQRNDKLQGLIQGNRSKAKQTLFLDILRFYRIKDYQKERTLCADELAHIAHVCARIRNTHTQIQAKQNFPLSDTKELYTAYTHRQKNPATPHRPKCRYVVFTDVETEQESSENENLSFISFLI